MSYDRQFYEARRDAALAAAHRLLGLLPAPLIKGKRVVDFGCGTGSWLAAARACGASHIVGFEGHWLDPAQVDDPAIDLHLHDLEQPIQLPQRADLALSLEVGEHLTPERADGFVTDICQAAPAVLFSAAIPGQGGTNHLNEQWQGWWAEKFMAQGFLAFDVIRPEIWTDEGVPFWYRQNTILYLSTAAPWRPDSTPVRDPQLLNRVHPELWARANRELAYAKAKPESEYLKEAPANAAVGPRPRAK